MDGWNFCVLFLFTLKREKGLLLLLFSLGVDEKQTVDDWRGFGLVVDRMRSQSKHSSPIFICIRKINCILN